MNMTIIEKMKVMQAAATSAIVSEQTTPVVVSTPGEKTLTRKEKKVKADATSGDITLVLPTGDAVDYDQVEALKVDASVNTVTVEGIDGGDVILTYVYQSILVEYHNGTWNIINEIVPTEFGNVVISATEPTDTNVLWYDIS